MALAELKLQKYKEQIVDDLGYEDLDAFVSEYKDSGTEDLKAKFGESLRHRCV